MNAGQMIYYINGNGEQTPYMIYGVENEMVMAISIHRQKDNIERICILADNINNLCFKMEDATDVDGKDYNVLRDALNKNEKSIKIYFKKNGIN
jgi:hypothetical protein